MSFGLPYKFIADNREVVIKHIGGKNLRVNGDAAQINGGTGEFARFTVEFVGGNGKKIKLKSNKTGKYLRIKNGAKMHDNDKIDAAGTGGKWTVFKVQTQGAANVVKLESAEQPGKYIAVQGGDKLRVGNGGPACPLTFFREGQAQAAAPFTKPYLFKKKNTVVLKHSQGKFIRVKPGNLGEADSDGGKGDFAQFEADPSDNGTKCRFKSKKTGKYLRIMGGDVNVGGTGGKFTVFKVTKGDNGAVKLQSEENGKYIAVGKNKKVRTGAGGPFCNIEIFRI